MSAVTAAPRPDVPSFAGAGDSLGASSADLDRWEALAAAATEGPWERAEGAGGPPAGYAVAHVRRVGVDDSYVVLGGSPTLDVDCEFIAASRTAVPALIAALREARDEVYRLRGRLLSDEPPMAWCAVCGRPIWEGDRLCCGTRSGAPVGSAAAAETGSAPFPHSGTPATVEAVSVAHSEEVDE